MALTDTQAKIIAANRKKREEEEIRSLAAAMLVKSTKPKTSSFPAVTPSRVVANQVTTPLKEEKPSSKRTTYTKVSPILADMVGSYGLRNKMTDNAGRLYTPLDIILDRHSIGDTAQTLAYRAKHYNGGDWRENLRKAAEEKVKRQEELAKYTLSDADQQLPASRRQMVLEAKDAWAKAEEAGDQKAMTRAHQKAENVRGWSGYSGGVTGNEYITAELTDTDRRKLTEAGQNRLKKALLDRQKAIENGDIQAQMKASEKIVAIRNDPASLRQPTVGKESLDAHGRTVERDVMTAEEARNFERRFQEGLYSTMAAVPGSLLSFLETTDQAIDNDVVERNRAYLQDKANRLYEYQAKLDMVLKGEGDPSWGSSSWLEQQVRIAENAKRLLSQGTNVDPNLPGQTLMRKSGEAAARALDGVEGWRRDLAQAAMAVGQNLPGVALSLIPGVGPALGAGLMGLQAAGGRAWELNEQNAQAEYASMILGGPAENYGAVDPARSSFRGLLSGIVEAGTGLIPLGRLANILKGKSGNGFVRNILEQMAMEGTEEGVSYMANFLLDKAAQDPNAEWTPEELWQNVKLGAIAGGMMAGGGSMVGSMVNRMPPAPAAEERTVQSIMEQQETQPEEEQQARDMAAAMLTGEAYVPPVQAKQEAAERPAEGRSGKVVSFPAQGKTDRQTASREGEEEIQLPRKEVASLKTQDVQMGISGQEVSLSEAAQTLGESGSKALLAAAGTTKDPVQYFADFARVYNQALTGTATSKIQAPASLNDAQVMAAYTAGQNDRAANLETAKAAAQYAPVAGEDAGLIYDDYVKSGGMDAAVASEINTVAKQLGLRVQMVDAVAGGTANAEIQGSMVRIEKGNPNPVRFLFGHEMTHRLQELAPESYQAFRDAVMQVPEAQTDVQRKVSEYKRAGVNLTTEQAMDEIAADYAGALIEDQQLLSRFIQRNKKNQSLLGRFLEALKDLARKLTGSRKKQADDAVVLLEKAVADASRQSRKLSANKNTAQTDGVRYSIKRTSKMTLAAQLKMFYDGKMASSDAFYFGQTPDSLTEAGLDPLPLAFTIADFKKSTQKKHNVPRRVLKNLNHDLETSLFTFSDGDRMGILTPDIDGDGKPLLVAIEKDVQMDAQKVNAIRSVYGLDNPAEWLANQISSEKVFSLLNEEKANAFLYPYGYLASRKDGIRFTGDTVAQGETDVKTRFSQKDSQGRAMFAGTKKGNLATPTGVQAPINTPEANGGTVSKSNVAQRGRDVNGRFSLKTDTQGRNLTAEQAEYFKDSQARDENGNLVVVYHGSREGGFTVFNRNQNYYTDNREMASSYAPGGDLYEGYLNITKPFVVDADGAKWSSVPVTEEVKEMLDAAGSSTFQEDGAWRTSVADIVGAVEDLVFEGEADYDGVIVRNVDDTGSHYKGEGRNLGTDYITFSSNQFKNVDNRKPTDDPDIRHSLKGGDDYQTLLEKYGFMEQGENPRAREVQVPRQTEEGKKVSRTVRTIMEAAVTTEEMLPTIEKLVEQGEFSYEVAGDREAIENAEVVIRDKGYQTALVDWISDVSKGSVSKQNTVTGWALYNAAVNEGDIKTAADIMSRIVYHQRNAAQAVQATRILKKMVPGAQLYAIQRSVQNMQSELVEKYGDKAPDLKIPDELVENFLAAETDEARLSAEEEIYRNIGKQMPSTFIDKWNAWRYLAMLGNFRTHIRNISGNLVFAPFVAAKNVVGIGLEAAGSMVSGGKMQRTKGVASPSLLAAGWSDYQNVVGQIMAGGKWDDSAYKRDAIAEGRQIFRFKPLELLRRLNSWALEKEDGWFAQPHYANALAQYCAANGITAEQVRTGEGVSKKELDKARAYAIKEAQKATYRDFNQFSDLISTLGRYDGSNKARKAFSAAVEGVLPFRKTPANILVRALEYSPVGLIQGAVQLAVGVPRGANTSAEALDHLASGLTGTGLVAAGYFLAKMGLLTAGPDDDEEQAKFDDLTGKQEYSWMRKDGTNFTLDWLAPECIPLLVGADIFAAIAEETDEEEKRISAFLGAMSQITDPLLEMSCLSSLNELFDNLNQFGEDGIKAGPVVLANMVVSYLTQGIPTLLGQGERASEVERMTTYTDKNGELPTDWQYVIGRASARIPKWDYNQIPYIDAWGRTESEADQGKRILNNFINPAYTSKYYVSQMEAELQRLYEATGEGVYPDRADRYFNVDGERVDLTADQYVTYAKEKGQRSYALIQKITTSSWYAGADDAIKAEVVSNAYQVANEGAKKALFPEYVSSINIYLKATQALEEENIAVGDYLYLRAITSDIESLKYASGPEAGETITNSKGYQIAEAIYDSGVKLTDSQRQLVYELFGNDVGKTVRKANPALVRQELGKMRRQAAET